MPRHVSSPHPVHRPIHPSHDTQTLSLFRFLSLCLSVCLSVCLCLTASVSLSLSLSLSLCVSQVILGCSAKIFPDEWRERAGPVLDFMSSSVATLVCSVVSTPQMVITDRESGQSRAWLCLLGVAATWVCFAELRAEGSILLVSLLLPMCLALAIF